MSLISKMSIILFLIFLALTGCTEPPERIEPFLWVKALPGDGTVSVQWWLNDSTLLYQGGKYGHLILMRSEEDGQFEQVAEFGPTNPLYAGWCWTDSSVENGIQYRYYVKAIFAIFTDPDAEGFSDTFTVTPQPGLADPRPSAPSSFTNDPLLEGSDYVTLHWMCNEPHDSVYYIFLAYGSVGFDIYHDNFDGTGREWDPSGTRVDPVKLDTTSYTFQCQRDGDTRYYKIAVFTDSVMSYSSEQLEIEHTWEDD
ncbi:hypothetical protein GF359_00835 [candidate division WOR-3 bacterium]|uniref:Uncharacterized protein n=1 Tax=candidate division WOR-3 bacterium TaxID=2052148 RepID=A0A9D5K8V8_UNCW3|nr:hypothetical protein [candidate division WOR-3 bacterium]MBD3363739.1 hypothetical protein [candidate division WOR-3 bacterium]